MTTGHIVDGHLSATFDITLSMFFHLKYVGLIQGLVTAHRDILLF